MHLKADSTFIYLKLLTLNLATPALFCSEVFFFLAVCYRATLIWSFSSSQDYIQAVTGLCYDGLEGLIYLVLFSFVTALMFSSIVCSVPHTWQPRR